MTKETIVNNGQCKVAIMSGRGGRRAEERAQPSSPASAEGDGLSYDEEASCGKRADQWMGIYILENLTGRVAAFWISVLE